MSTYKLTYFNSRGNAEVARLVFKAAGVEFEDERLEMEEWTKRKPEMPLGALPVLQIDDKMFCQSAAIARYLAQEFDLMGCNNLEALRIDEVMEVFAEMTNKELMKMYFEKDEDKKKELIHAFTKEPMRKYLNFVEKVLKENNGGKGFLVGDKLSLGDLIIYHGLTMLGVFKVDPFKDRPLLKEHFERVEAVPNISKWVKERPQTNY